MKNQKYDQIGKFYCVVIVAFFFSLKKLQFRYFDKKKMKNKSLRPSCQTVSSSFLKMTKYNHINQSQRLQTLVDAIALNKFLHKLLLSI